MENIFNIRFPIRVLLLLAIVTSSSSDGKRILVKPKPPPCDSEIYCYGPLLAMVQLNSIYPDDKTFVDQPLKFPPEEVLANFRKFRSQSKYPSRSKIIQFLNDNFYPNDGQEYEPWIPSDWGAEPKFLTKIADPHLRAWGATLHAFWKDLGRNMSADVRAHPEKYSLVPVNNPVIVPGGRFKEIYYWDTYWIIRGLLQSEMFTTVKGIIQNFLDQVEKQGFVPNGGRIYYQRSQPPLLIPMMKAYFDATLDVDFLRASLPTLEKEFNFWIEHRATSTTVKKRRYRGVRYCSDKTGPRPESYKNDYELAKALPTKKAKRALYTNIQSAAESGWDFSSRWYIPEEMDVKGNNTDISTCQIIPADLNALMYMNAQTLTKLHALSGDLRRGYLFIKHANDFKRTLDKLLWDPDLGSYFDYDKTNKRLVKDFYASSIVPLWAEVDTSPKTVAKILAYLNSKKVFEFPGGIPASLYPTREQWDFPNGWAPLNHMAIEALNKTGNPAAQTLAAELAQKWIGSNYKAFYAQTPNTMFEKYDVTKFGQPGSGGEYTVVAGFGWTNGVVLDLLSQYGNVLKV